MQIQIQQLLLSFLLLVFLFASSTRAATFHRMSVLPNSSTVNPHFWDRGDHHLDLSNWYSAQYYQNYRNNYHYYSRNHKVFHLQFLAQTDVRCNDGTRAGSVKLIFFLSPCSIFSTTTTATTIYNNDILVQIPSRFYPPSRSITILHYHLRCPPPLQFFFWRCWKCKTKLFQSINADLPIYISMHS